MLTVALIGVVHVAVIWAVVLVEDVENSRFLRKWSKRRRC